MTRSLFRAYGKGESMPDRIVSQMNHDLNENNKNFMFVTLDRKTGVITTELTAGNHWETDNVYKLYFYYFNSIKGYDELVGYSVVNSH